MVNDVGDIGLGGGIMGIRVRAGRRCAAALAAVVAASVAVAIPAPVASAERTDRVARKRLLTPAEQRELEASGQVTANKDGSYTVELSSRDDGVLPTQREDGAYTVSTREYSATAPRVLGEEGMRIEWPSGWFTFAPVNAKATARVEGSMVTYQDVYPGVHLRYVFSESGVKEEVVVERPSALRGAVEFDFELGPDVQLLESEDGGMTFSSRGNLIARLSAPWLVDPRGSVSNAVRLDGGGPGSHRRVALRLDLDSHWIKAAERSWPLVIDPSVEFKPPGIDCWIGNNSHAEISNCANQYMRVGVTDAGDKRRALLRFDVDAIPVGSTISNADVSLHLDTSMTTNPGAGAYYVLRRVKRAWNGAATWISSDGTTVWGTRGGDFGTLDAGNLAIGGGNASAYKNFDTTWLVQDWVDGAYEKHGFLLKAETEAVKNVLYFHTAEANSGVRPKLTVTFTPPAESGSEWYEEYGEMPGVHFWDPDLRVEGNDLVWNAEASGPGCYLQADPSTHWPSPGYVYMEVRRLDENGEPDEDWRGVNPFSPTSTSCSLGGHYLSVESTSLSGDNTGGIAPGSVDS